MNDAAPIRRCSGALRANHLLVPAPDPKISNREPLRLELDVTRTKQTTQPHSNQEAEALFSNHYRSTRHLNLKNSNRESRPSNREESHALQIMISAPAPTARGRGQLHSRIPKFQPSKKAKSSKKHPQSLFRLEPTPVLYFQQLTRNLNDTMFRLEMKKGGKKQAQSGRVNARKPEFICDLMQGALRRGPLRCRLRPQRYWWRDRRFARGSSLPGLVRRLGILPRNFPSCTSVVRGTFDRAVGLLDRRGPERCGPGPRRRGPRRSGCRGPCLRRFRSWVEDLRRA